MARGLDALFRPRSIAIVGASTDPKKIGGRPLANMLRAGFKGRLLPVNPSQKEVQGLPAFASLDDVPGPVDQAIGSLCRADLVSVPANASVHDAVLAMQRNSVRRLLAVDEDNAVVGVLSADDVCQAIAAELDALAASLRGNVIAEGARERARARTQGEPPQPLYATRHEP